MTDDKYKGWALGLVLLSAIVLFFGRNGQMNGKEIASLIAVLGVSFFLPLLGFMFAVPVFLLVWIRNYKSFLEYLNQLKEVKCQKKCF